MLDSFSYLKYTNIGEKRLSSMLMTSAKFGSYVYRAWRAY